MLTYERFGSRRTVADNNTTLVESLWRVEGSNDELEVRAFVAAASSPIYLDTQTNRLLFRSDHTVDQIGYLLWDVVINYKNEDEQNNPSTPTFTFDTTGGTAHITQSYGTTVYGAAPKPSFNGAIGVRDNQVEGVDVVIPALRISETWPIPAALVTSTYMDTLAGLTGHTNNGAWRQYAANSVLFMGASGASQSDGYVPVTYSFEVSPNATLSIAGIGGISKKGWDYVWTFYESKTDDDLKLVLKKPKHVFVEKVYTSVDFGQIGI